MLLGLPAGWLLCECVLCSPTNIWALSQVSFTIVPFIENLSRAEEDNATFSPLINLQVTRYLSTTILTGSHKVTFQCLFRGPPLRQIDCCHNAPSTMRDTKSDLALRVL